MGTPSDKTSSTACGHSLAKVSRVLEVPPGEHFPDNRSNTFRGNKQQMKNLINNVKSFCQKHSRKLAVAGAILVSTPAARAADYADAAAVNTAVIAIPTTVTTAFLAAATLGVSFLLVRMVARGLKKGLSIG